MSRTKRDFTPADRKVYPHFICLCPGPAFTATAHPAAHNLGPAVHHSSHGAISEPVHHNTVHNSISSAPSIVHTTEVHHGVKVKCPSCFKHFPPSGLKQHIRSVHHRERKRCPHCPENFLLGSLSRHIRRAHKDA